jgi:hypothetical protein
MTSQTYDDHHPPLPKPEESKLPVESSCQRLKPKHLPVRTILLMHSIIQNNVHGVGLWEQWQVAFCPFNSNRRTTENGV